MTRLFIRRIVTAASYIPLAIGAVALCADAAALADAFDGTAAGTHLEIDGTSFCWCPPGKFFIGSPEEELDHRTDEHQKRVTLSKGFWIGKYEVTQKQWLNIMGKHPDQPPSERFGVGDDVPVYWVSYLDAASFCTALTDRLHATGQLPELWTCRLPTEAQWEYACRAGSQTATAFGDALSRDQANFGGALYGGGADGPAIGRATRVGSYAANAWGLCDMHGNVFEWCRDWYHEDFPGVRDPDFFGAKGTPNRDGTYSRVRRGGAWNDDGQYCRSAFRLRYEPDRRSDHIGFRVVLVAAGTTSRKIDIEAADGGRITADVYGKGDRCVVLAHGGRFCRESWEPQAVVLANAGFRVVAIDFRGYGSSHGPGENDVFSAPLHLDVLAAVQYLKENGAKNISVIGGSMGGGAAADATAVSRPGEIDRLVVLGTAAGSEAPEKIQGRKLVIATRDDANADGPRLPRIQRQFEQLKEPKKFILYDGAAHAQFMFFAEYGDRVMQEILTFLSAE